MTPNSFPRPLGNPWPTFCPCGHAWQGVFWGNSKQLPRQILICPGSSDRHRQGAGRWTVLEGWASGSVLHTVSDGYRARSSRPETVLGAPEPLFQGPALQLAPPGQVAPLFPRTVRSYAVSPRGFTLSIKIWNCHLPPSVSKSDYCHGSHGQVWKGDTEHSRLNDKR